MNRVPRILVVEDEAHIARLLEFVLRRTGFEIEVALTGGAALRSLQREAPDAVLLDLQLPDMGGAEVFSAIRARAESRDAAVIILSAHTFEYGADQSFRDARTVYCPKPVAPSRLIECLSAFGLSAPVAAKAG
jgi:DNA-binding response OmpR family regulator